jgi:phosphatidate cytidylyltransferase
MKRLLDKIASWPQLGQRIFTAVILLVVLILCLMANSSYFFLTFLCLIGFAASWEIMRLFQQTPTISRYFLLFSSLGLLGIPWFNQQFMLMVIMAAFGLWLTWVPYTLYSKKILRNPLLVLPLSAVLVLATVYSAWLLYLKSPYWLFGAAVVVWLADVAAYFTGKAFGKHKLAPNISPGKSWEGVYGAFIAVMAYATWLSHAFNWPLLALLGAGFFLLVYSVFGDLYESLLKRQSHYKDSSQLLPGHGGVLDRIDALMPVLPMAYLIMANHLS